ncbi:hypothetical protein CRE_03932 [Caenorhabditis remanei]|uniref:Uncharacterized protein n=1 Tax=Caenorhabditis remanei TaxID=31234 RepID=E3LXY2_CAERE|nr:hypothetical protein CRE_03932 [Caenorhabditis remanei]
MSSTSLTPSVSSHRSLDIDNFSVKEQEKYAQITSSDTEHEDSSEDEEYVHTECIKPKLTERKTKPKKQENEDTVDFVPIIEDNVDGLVVELENFGTTSEEIKRLFQNGRFRSIPSSKLEAAHVRHLLKDFSLPKKTTVGSTSYSQILSSSDDVVCMSKCVFKNLLLNPSAKGAELNALVLLFVLEDVLGIKTEDTLWWQEPPVSLQAGMKFKRAMCHLYDIVLPLIASASQDLLPPNVGSRFWNLNQDACLVVDALVVKHGDETKSVLKLIATVHLSYRKTKSISFWCISISFNFRELIEVFFPSNMMIKLEITLSKETLAADPLDQDSKLDPGKLSALAEFVLRMRRLADHLSRCKLCRHRFAELEDIGPFYSVLGIVNAVLSSLFRVWYPIDMKFEFGRNIMPIDAKKATRRVIRERNREVKKQGVKTYRKEREILPMRKNLCASTSIQVSILFRKCFCVRTTAMLRMRMKQSTSIRINIVHRPGSPMSERATSEEKLQVVIHQLKEQLYKAAQKIAKEETARILSRIPAKYHNMPIHEFLNSDPPMDMVEALELLEVEEDSEDNNDAKTAETDSTTDIQ